MEDLYLAASEFTYWIQDEMARLRIPGLALGVLFGEQTYRAAYGVTSVENPLPVSADTLFQVGSISKTFTALAVMRLVERGELALDRPLIEDLPELRLADLQVQRRVTLRHIFTHTGGWLGDYFDDTGRGDDALAKIVARLGDLPQQTPLGEIWSYNNAGFYLAGRVIEVKTGKTYEAALQELVLDPLEMHHSFYDPADVMTHRFVVGHSAVFPGQAGEPAVQRPWALARAGSPVGGLAASLNDMLRYARFQLGDGCIPGSQARLLSSTLLQEMQRPCAPAAHGEQFGVSWFIRALEDLQVLRHGGATHGQMATFQFVPGRDLAVVVLTNSDRGDELYTPLAAHLVERLLHKDYPKPQVIEHPEHLAGFAGRYTAAADDYTLDWRDGELWLLHQPRGGFPAKDSPPSAAHPPVRVALCAPDCWMVVDEPGQGDLGEILRDPQGRIAWLRFGGRVHRRID
ncbi:MAG: serine hydrolase domain-containing protein [Chloroflexota bacterium]